MTVLISPEIRNSLYAEMERRESTDKLPAFILDADLAQKLSVSLMDPEFATRFRRANKDIKGYYLRLMSRLDKRIERNQGDLFAGADAYRMIAQIIEPLAAIYQARADLEVEARTAYLAPLSILNKLSDSLRFGVSGAESAMLSPIEADYLVRGMENKSFQHIYHENSEYALYVQIMISELSANVHRGQVSGFTREDLKTFVAIVVEPMQTQIMLRKSASKVITNEMVAKVCKTLRENRGVSDVAMAGHVINTLMPELAGSD